MDFKKNNEESNLQYIWRLASAKDNGTLDITWDELAKIFNENLNQSMSSSAYRKPFQQAKVFYDDVFSNMESSEYNKELMAQRRELERLKIQYRDERNAWNKQNYIDARVSQKLDYLEETLQEIGKVQFKCDYGHITSSDNDLLIILSDLHIGQTFSSQWGEYNTDIAKERMRKLLCEVVKIANRHKSQNIYIQIAGDLLSGQIHKTLAITNRENVIEQIKIASEIISSFCVELSHLFNNVYITNVSGNHSRIDKKDEALHDERLDDLIGWIVENTTKHIENIKFLHSNLDIGIAEMTIRGKKYISCHGDYDNFSKNGISNLCMMLGYMPYAITMGHLHTCALDECNGVKMVRGGSLAGSGDAYTIEKRLSGKPSQMVCVCSDKGIDCYYPIELV